MERKKRKSTDRRDTSKRAASDGIAARRRRRIQQIRRARRRRVLIGAALLCIFIVSVFVTAAAISRNSHADIVLRAESSSMLQGEQKPAFKAEADCEERQTDIVLEEESGYTVQDLLDDLNKGEGYTLQCDSDGVTEGEYPVTVELSDTLKKKLDSDWKEKAALSLKKGSLTVKNRTGEWEGDKFKRWDGTYVTSGFVDYKGSTYYFDEKGKKVTGERDAGIYRCVFDDKGRMQSREFLLDPEKPMMALTFDDGPGKRTNELLDVLEEYDAHATFFMLGKMIPGREDAIKRMSEIGCEIGNHSYDHPNLTSLGADGVSGQIGDTNSLLKQACGQAATVMRPPYGAVNDDVASGVKLPMVLWNVDTLDWETRDTQAVIDNVLCNADDGDIVLMHDIYDTTIDAAVALIPQLIDKGYQLVTVSEMAQARGITLENGGLYTDFNK